MITVQNFKSIIDTVDLTKFAKAFEEIKESVKDSIQDYNEDEDVKEFIDTYIKKLNLALDKDKKDNAPETKKPKSKEAIFSYNLTRRDFSIGTYPENDFFLNFEEDNSQFGRINYSKKLSYEEMKKFELSPITDILEYDGITVYTLLGKGFFSKKLTLNKTDKGISFFKVQTQLNGKGKIVVDNLKGLELIQYLRAGNYTLKKPKLNEKDSKSNPKFSKGDIVSVKDEFLSEEPNYAELNKGEVVKIITNQDGIFYQVRGGFDNMQLAFAEDDLRPYDNKKEVDAAFLKGLRFVSKMMPTHQLNIMLGNDEMYDELIRIDDQLAKIPTTEEGIPADEKMVYAKYFYAGTTIFILDRINFNTFFCFTILNDDSEMAELGYQGISEIMKNGKIELDFYWTPVTLGEAKFNVDSTYFKKPLDKAIVKKAAPIKKAKAPIKKIAKKVDITLVDAYSKEFRLIRRFFNLIKKPAPATFRQMQLLYMDYQKSIVSKEVSKKNVENSDLFIEVNKKVVKLYDTIIENENLSSNNVSANVTLKDSSLFKKMEVLVGGTQVNYAVTLLRSYINIENTMPEVSKVNRLLKRFEKAIKDKRLMPSNRLFDQINDSIIEMKKYIKNPKSEIPVEVYGLAAPAPLRKCKNRIKCQGLQSNGMLKKGYQFTKGGQVIKVSAKGMGAAITVSKCDNRIKCNGLNSDGTVKKGYKYTKGGKVVKVSTLKKKR